MPWPSADVTLNLPVSLAVPCVANVELIEGSDADAVKAAGENVLSDVRLQGWGAKPQVLRGLYQMEYSIQNLAN